MICNKCGKPNDGNQYCMYCGAKLQPENVPETSAPQVQPASNIIEPQPYQPDSETSEPHPPYQTMDTPDTRPRKKRRTWLIIGIAVAVLAVTAITLFFTLTYPLQGRWYSEERGEVLAFDEDGNLSVVRLMNESRELSSYDRLAGKGSINVDGISYTFSTDGKTLEANGLGTYIRADESFNTDKFLKKFSSLGTWYSEERGEVLALNMNGEAQRTRLVGTQEARYEYARAENTGTLSIGETSYEFSLADDSITLDGLGIYTRVDDSFNKASFLEEYGQIGTWYSEETGQVLVFDRDGTLQCFYSGASCSGTYFYRQDTHAVSITIGSFIYAGKFEASLLTAGSMGEFAEADFDFDTEAFLAEYGSSVMGVWYDTDGELVIDLHPDGTYDAIAYGTSFDGEYLLSEGAVDISFNVFGVKSEVRYSLLDGQLIKDDQSGFGTVDTLVRAETNLKQDRYSPVFGPWISDDYLLVYFVSDTSVYIYSSRTGKEAYYDYKYDPLSDIGFINFGTDWEVFVCDGDTLVLWDIVFLPYS